MAFLPTQLPYVFSLGLVLVLSFAIKLLRFGSREKHLPPGPSTIPILGNAHLLIGQNLHHKYVTWGKKYGSVYSLKVGKGTIIVLNSKRAVYELADKKGNIYSGRPFLQQISDTTHDKNMTLMDANPRWKAQRKMILQYLSPSNLDGKLVRIFEAEMSALLQDLLVNPQVFREHIKRCVASAAAIAIYGQRATSDKDFWSEASMPAIFELLEKLTTALTPGSYLPVEQFPILKMIPDRWNPARLTAADSYQTTVDLATEAMSRVEQRRRQGDHRNCMLESVLDGHITPDIPMIDKDFAIFFSTVWAAAADTSAIAILTNLRYLAAHPEVQRKAQFELDEVCGADRAPTWADSSRVPYINCIMKEGLRINGVVPLGVPHRVTEDDWYEGMLIPKDAMVMIPTHVLGRLTYKDGDTYNPDRYFDHPRFAMDYASSSDYEKRDHHAYGAGRRLCAGIHLAERTQWRVFAKLLWAFKIEPGVDERTGEVVEIDTEAYDDNLAPWPLPFKLKFVPRSEKHVEVIRREFQDVRAYLESWE